MATEEMRTRSARNTNPFQRIPFQPADLSAPESGGGGSKELVPVTTQYRATLIDTLQAAAEKLRPEIAIHPASPGVLIFKLRDTAIAKSHRPNTLAAEAGLQLAGVARIEEMLVAANAASLHSLVRVIHSRDTKQIRANLSAIETIQAWDQSRRMAAPALQLRQRGRVLLSLFRFNAADATARNVDALRSLLLRFNVKGEELAQRWGPPVFRLHMDVVSNEALEVLSVFPGLRSIFPEPRAHSAATIVAGFLPGQVPPPTPGVELPVVGVFDTGTAAGATSLRPWISGSLPYLLPPDTDYVHGTAVASLIAGAKPLNGAHAWLPSTPCQIQDVCGLEAAGGNISDLVIRLSDAIRRTPAVKVWNLSLGAGQIGDDEFSYFAQQLDALSDEHKVLFIVASGNYLDLPRRGWPADPNLQDRLSSPGDSVRALTVGSIAHLDAPGAMVAAGEPAPYSRRGPGPVFTPKPDLVHAGGGVHPAWNSGISSLQVLSPTNAPYGNFGTSFAAPIVTSVAGHVWQSLEGRPNATVTPHMVKALLIHAARLASPDYSAHERRYYGCGIPKDALSALYDTDDCFTMIFEALVVPGFKWRKTPYPIPASLLQNGKLRAEVIITAVYSPPLDPNSGAEYVRANVSVSFGVLEDGKIKGKVPMEGEAGTDGYEAAQIEHGGKWSPVKLHRKQFPQGVAGDQWAIQLEALLRANEPPLAEPMNVALIVSMRSIDGNTQVHADGIRALVGANWVHEQLPVRVPVTV